VRHPCAKTGADAEGYWRIFRQVRPRTPRSACGVSFVQQETGLSVGTIGAAIAVLVDEGIAYRVPGRGTFASEKQP
jgi:hypothetical protein